MSKNEDSGFHVIWTAWHVLWMAPNRKKIY